MIALQGLNLACRNIMGTEFRRNTRENAFNPLWNHYRCADGKWLTLGMLQADRYWKDLCNTLGLPELIDDPRFKEISVRGKNCKALVAIFDKVFITKPRDEWMKPAQGRRRLHLHRRQPRLRPARRLASAGQRLRG